MDQNKLLFSLSYFYPEFCHHKEKVTNSTIPLPGAETISQSSEEPCVRLKRVLKAVLSGESPRYFQNIPKEELRLPCYPSLKQNPCFN